jgi:Rod binding domain-containing protein
LLAEKIPSRQEAEFRMDALKATLPGQVAGTERRLARQLESSFAAELLRSARPEAKSGGFAGRGTGGDAFDSFMDDALGAALVARGGLGLGGAIESSIRGRQAGLGQ